MRSFVGLTLASLACSTWYATAQEPSVSPGSVAPTAPTSAPSPTGASLEGTNWSGCYESGPVKIEIGKSTLVCFHIAGTSINWSSGVSYLRRSFAPEADQYSRFHINNFYRDFVTGNQGSPLSGPITVGAAAATSLSFLRVFLDNRGDEPRVFPYLTAIIDVDRGVVQGITWDDSCVFCGRGRCVQNTYDYNGNNMTQAAVGFPTDGCFHTLQECSTDDDPTLCDLTIYVVWTGTDVNGVGFQSAASRFSQFPIQELQDRLSQNLPPPPDIRGTISDAIPDLPGGDETNNRREML